MDKWLAELEEKYRKTAPFIQTIIPLDDSDAILKNITTCSISVG